MQVYCHSCNANITLSESTQLNQCFNCTEAVVSISFNENYVDDKVLQVKQEVSLRMEKVFCENCACCEARTSFPSCFGPMEMPAEGSAEERVLLLAYCDRQREKIEKLEKELELSNADQQELTEEIVNNQRLMTTWSENIDGMTLENVTLVHEVNSLTDACDMLRRQNDKIEEILDSLVKEINTGKYNVKAKIDQLNGLEMSVTVDAAPSTSDDDVNEILVPKRIDGKKAVLLLCDDVLNSSEGSFTKVIKELCHEKVMRKHLDHRYMKASADLEEAKFENVDLAKKLRDANEKIRRNETYNLPCVNCCLTAEDLPDDDDNNSLNSFELI